MKTSSSGPGRTEQGRLFMVGLPGPDLDASTVRLIREYGINNFIIFKRNVENPKQLRLLCRRLHKECSAHGLPLPLISIDQEGGTVNRLPPPFTQFDAARDLALSSDPEQSIRSYAMITAQELRDVGINMNLAPVLDVCPTDKGFFMESRAFGEDPEVVSHLGALVIKVMQEKGVAACAKHFPGLGRAVIDPHKHLPTVERPLEKLEALDLIPFKDAIRDGVAAIMTSHTIYPALDSDFPATLSEKIIRGLLRTTLNYNGLIITDDLEMGAIENEGALEKAALKSFLAGADMLLICHDHEKVEKAYLEIESARADGIIGSERISASCQRVASVSSAYAITF